MEGPGHSFDDGGSADVFFGDVADFHDRLEFPIGAKPVPEVDGPGALLEGAEDGVGVIG